MLRVIKAYGVAVVAVTLVVVLWPHSTARGQVQGLDPSEPIAPTDYAQCDQLASEWRARRAALFAQMEACEWREYEACANLPLRQQIACREARINPRWADSDPVARCNQVVSLYYACQSVKNAWACAMDAEQPAVERCRESVRSSADRIRRVNEVLTSYGSTTGELLAEATISQQISVALGDSQVARDLGRVSAIAQSAGNIQASLRALQLSGQASASASVSHVVDVLRELARHGLSRSPIALFLTDFALQYVGTVQGNALADLHNQLQRITRHIESRTIVPAVPAPAVPPISGSSECAVLKNEQQNRALMEADPSRWLALVQRCTPP